MGETVKPVEIGVGGMTCAACVRRVENGLRKIPAVVDASVNLATERAHVQFGHSPDENDIRAVHAAIEKLGYEPKPIATSNIPDNRDVETSQLWRLFLGSAMFTLPLLLIAMVPMLSSSVMNVMMTWLTMEQWNWVMLALAIPVQFWFGGRFYVWAQRVFSQVRPI